MTTNEKIYLEAQEAYDIGSPIMSDDEFDFLKENKPSVDEFENWFGKRILLA